MIDDKPRSATVIAVEETVVREIHREHFFHNLQTNPEAALHLLKILFERLREADATILRLLKAGAPLVPAPVVHMLEAPAQTVSVVCLEGCTPRAARALSVTPFLITKFPFRIGRQSYDPLAHNDLMIPDSIPLQISRHHLAFVKHDGHIGVADRGSRLGSLVDGQQVGGTGGIPGPVFFHRSEGRLILGNSDSPFQYRVILKAAP